MPEPKLLQLAQDLEWLGCELEYVGHKHALEGFPESGPTWDQFREQQRGVLATADKVERELKNFVRFNPTRLVGVEYPIAQSLDSITDLLGSAETIKQAAAVAVNELPPLVRNFTKMVEGYLQEVDGARR
ncbi:MAG: hypothetical protein ABSE79_05930 [Terriglobia bacterium]|jgi:hypothetical protein